MKPKCDVEIESIKEQLAELTSDVTMIKDSHAKLLMSAKEALANLLDEVSKAETEM